MTKSLALLLVLMMGLSLSACGKNQQTTPNPESNPSVHVTAPNDNDISIEDNVNVTEGDNTKPAPSLGNVDSLESIEEIVSKDFEDTISLLEKEWEELCALIDTYDSYINNVSMVEAFYNNVNCTTEQMCARMYEYALDYAECIMASSDSASEKYDDFDELYDCVYDDAGNELYDEIYDGILGDMYDVFYDGILKDAYDTVPYDEWSDVRSDEYDWWSDTRSDVYDNWSDARSKIYNFWSDIRSDLWNNEVEEAEKELEDFRNDVTTDHQTPSGGSASTDTAFSPSADIALVGTIEELEINATKDVDNVVKALNSEWEALLGSITTYDAYISNADKVESFYEKINNSTEHLCIRLQEYTAKYAELIMTSDMSSDDKYDAFNDLKSCIYDDVADDLKDEIYDGLLEDMKDAFYEGVLDDSEDADSYSDWYDVHSGEYSNWYDTRFDVYDNWYDTRSDIYDFYFDMRDELWEEDVDKAMEVMGDYKEDVEKPRT